MVVMETIKKKHDYQLARDLIIRLILESQYKPGDKLPSRPKLAEMLGVGIISMQQAIKTLEKEGTLYNIKGSGCFLKNIPSINSSSGDKRMPNSEFDAEMLFGHSSTPNSKLSIRFAVFPGELEFYGDGWKRVLSEFERESHGIAVETFTIGNMEELLGGLRQGKVDVFQIPIYQLPNMIKSGFVLQPGSALNLDAGSFFKPIYEASCAAGGTPWGVPLATACNCLFFNGKWKGIVQSATEAGGFWRFLERLEKAPLPGELEAFIANNHTIDELFRIACTKLKPGDFDSDSVITFPEFSDFIAHIDRYYRNPRIFHPSVKEGCEDSMINLAGGLSAMSFGSTSWISCFQRIRFQDWNIIAEPYETETNQKATSVINCISSLTYHVDEALSLLNHLGKAKVQRVFARKGQIVASKEAFQDTKGIDLATKARLTSIIETGRVPMQKFEGADEFLTRVLRPESGLWRSGKFTAVQFIESIKRKHEIFKNRFQAISNG